MNVRTPLPISLLLLAVVLAVTAWGWVVIPAGAKIAIHWGMDGQPNGWAGKTEGLLFVPLLASFLTALFWLIPRIEPRKRNLATGRAFYTTAWLGSLALQVLVQVVIVLYARGTHLNVGVIALASLAVLFMAIGTFLGKTRPNFFAGVRTPWSLSSDLAWEKSNRAAGRLFVLTGLATLAALLIAGTPAATVALFVGLIGSAAISIVLSYIYWRRDPHRHTLDFRPE